MTIQSVNPSNNPNTTNSTPSTTNPAATSQQVANTQANLRRTQTQITAYINDIANEPVSSTNNQKLMDIDGDGQVNERDAKLVFAYLRGQRGNQLKDELSPYANSSVSAMRDMETKMQSLINSKKLDINNDGKVDSQDGRSLQDGFKTIQQNKTTLGLNQNIEEGKFDIDGNGITDQKDIDLIREHIIGKKTAAQIAQKIGPNANANTINEKLTAIKSNRNVDSNVDGKVNAEDISKLSNHVRNYNREKQKTNETNKINGLINNKTIDVDRDGQVSSNDTDIIEAYLQGKRGNDLKNKSNRLSTQTSAQIEANVKALVDNKSLDINNDQKVNFKDFHKIKKAAQAHETLQQTNSVNTLINNNVINVDGNNRLENKDLDLLRAYLQGRRGDQLKGFLRRGDNLTQIETKLGELSRNMALDIDKNGLINQKDLDLIYQQFSKIRRP
jgi:hypothetical protein